MVCLNCGEQVSESAKFCAVCGKPMVRPVLKRETALAAHSEAPSEESPSKPTQSIHFPQSAESAKLDEPAYKPEGVSSRGLRSGKGLEAKLTRLPNFALPFAGISVVLLLLLAIVVTNHNAKADTPPLESAKGTIIDPNYAAGYAFASAHKDEFVGYGSETGLWDYRSQHPEDPNYGTIDAIAWCGEVVPLTKSYDDSSPYMQWKEGCKNSIKDNLLRSS